MNRLRDSNLREFGILIVNLHDINTWKAEQSEQIITSKTESDRICTHSQKFLWCSVALRFHPFCFKEREESWSLDCEGWIWFKSISTQLYIERVSGYTDCEETPSSRVLVLCKKKKKKMMIWSFNCQFHKSSRNLLKWVFVVIVFVFPRRHMYCRSVAQNKDPHWSV